MRITGVSAAIVLAATFAAATFTPVMGAEAHHWGYEGEANPAVWGELSEEFKTCAVGEEQSPIDIVSTGTVPASFQPAVVHWQPFVPTVVNNGHTIQVNTDSKGGYADLGGVRYDLLQFHFHHQSEHTIDGQHAPLEVHFVHKSKAGDLLVLGVLLQPGKASATVGTVWAGIPKEGEETVGTAPLDPSDMLPKDTGSFRYEGSLTTPPCSQIVTWNVFAHPTEVSTAQIDAFSTLYPNDARPVQQLHRRFVLSDDAAQ